jgi:hypothetical protein
MPRTPASLLPVNCSSKSLRGVRFCRCFERQVNIHQIRCGFFETGAG